MAFSKARRLSDLISATGEVAAYADASIVPADLHSTLDLTGKTITVANASTGDSDTTVANTAFVQQEIAALVASAPGTLNTLNELAAALGDDASFSTTVTNSIATKLPLAGGTMTGALTVTGDANPALEISRGSANTTNVNLKYNTTLTGQLSAANEKFQISAAGSGTEMEFYVNGAKRLEIDTTGKVKIGNNIPMWSGEYGGALLLKGNNSTTDRFAEITTVDSNGATTGTGLVVKGAGVSMKVGIGTNSPIRLLDIKDQGTGDPGIRMESQSYNMDVVTLRNGDGRVGFGADAITVLQSGEVGIGGIPSVHYTGYEALDIGTSLSLMSNNSSTNISTLTNNGYLNSNASNWVRKVQDESSMFEQVSGQHRFKSAGSGSAGSAITWLERMRIHANGKVGFSANGMGDVNTIPRDFAFFTEGGSNGVEVRSNDQRLVMIGAAGSGGTSSDDGYISMSSQGTTKIALNANGVSTFNGGAVGINRTPSISGSKLEIGGADNVRLIALEASGHTGGFGINGGTGKDRGLQIFSGANIIATFNNQTNVAYTSDGLFAANARPNRINCTGSGQMLFGYTDSGSGLYSAAMGMEFDEHNGQNPPISQWVDGWVMKALVSGTKTLRIETDGDIYNVNGTFSSGSDRRIKKEISDASSQWDDVKAVRVRKFKLGATEAGSPHDHFHIGVIAQEIEEAGMNGLVKETTPDDGHIKFNPALAGDKIKTVKYSILQMKAFKALQEAMEKIETLEAKVAALEAE